MLLGGEPQIDAKYCFFLKCPLGCYVKSRSMPLSLSKKPFWFFKISFNFFDRSITLCFVKFNIRQESLKI